MPFGKMHTPFLAKIGIDRFNNPDKEVTALAITAIASDPTDSNIIYVGTGEKIGTGNIGLGIWKTSDGGANWARLTSSEGSVSYTHLRAHET